MPYCNLTTPRCKSARPQRKPTLPRSKPSMPFFSPKTQLLASFSPTGRLPVLSVVERVEWVESFFLRFQLNTTHQRLHGAQSAAYDCWVIILNYFYLDCKYYKASGSYPLLFLHLLTKDIYDQLLNVFRRKLPVIFHKSCI